MLDYHGLPSIVNSKSSNFKINAQATNPKAPPSNPKTTNSKTNPQAIDLQTSPKTKDFKARLGTKILNSTRKPQTQRETNFKKSILKPQASKSTPKTTNPELNPKSGILMSLLQLSSITSSEQIPMNGVYMQVGRIERIAETQQCWCSGI